MGEVRRGECVEVLGRAGGERWLGVEERGGPGWQTVAAVRLGLERGERSSDERLDQRAENLNSKRIAVESRRTRAPPRLVKTPGRRPRRWSPPPFSPYSYPLVFQDTT